MKRFIFESINEWKQLKGGFNWYTLTIINIEIENDYMHRAYEFLFILLGLGFRIRYNTKASTEIYARYDRLVEEAMKENEVNS